MLETLMEHPFVTTFALLVIVTAILKLAGKA